MFSCLVLGRDIPPNGRFVCTFYRSWGCRSWSFGRRLIVLFRSIVRGGSCSFPIDNVFGCDRRSCSTPGEELRWLEMRRCGVCRFHSMDRQPNVSASEEEEICRRNPSCQQEWRPNLRLNSPIFGLPDRGWGSVRKGVDLWVRLLDSKRWTLLRE